MLLKIDRILINFPYQENDDAPTVHANQSLLLSSLQPDPELSALEQMCEAEYAMRRKKSNVYHMGLVTRTGAEKSLKGVADRDFRRHYPVPPRPVTQQFVHQVNMAHNSIFIGGR